MIKDKYGRLTRKGWPLVTIETEVNGDLKSTNKRGPSLAGSLGSSCQYTRFLSCSGQPSTNYSFLHRTLFQSMCPHRPATWAGSRAGPPVSECVPPIVHTKPYNKSIKYLSNTYFPSSTSVQHLIETISPHILL